MEIRKWLVKGIQVILDVGMLLLAILLIFFMGKELLYLGEILLISADPIKFSEVAEATLAFFLYFEFVSLIKIFFEKKSHIPLPYFMYIGITAILRIVMATHNNAVNTLLFSGAILILIIALVILKKDNISET